jgi:AcrR family transcriptional regulator
MFENLIDISCFYQYSIKGQRTYKDNILIFREESMTQFVKEEIRQAILAAAREEFLKCGFEGASIRTVAANAKTAKSNLYNYYADKDALFAAVMGKTVEEIRQGLAAAKEESAGETAQTYTMASQGRYMGIVGQYVGTHTQDLSLLLFRSAGSSLAGFADEVADGFTDVLADWLSAFAPLRAPSRLFIRCVAGFYLEAVERMLLAKPTAEQAAAYMGEFLKFVYGGWNAILNQVG